MCATCFLLVFLEAFINVVAQALVLAIFVRVMRTPSAVIYGPDYVFEFGRGCILRDHPSDAAVIVSSGRGVHEALAASDLCARDGLHVGVVDMPSIDEELLVALVGSGKLICLAEQNNGYILQNLLRVLHRRGVTAPAGRVLAINTLDKDGRPHYIHSGTYEELIEAFELTPAHLSRAIASRLERTRS